MTEAGPVRRDEGAISTTSAAAAVPAPRTSATPNTRAAYYAGACDRSAGSGTCHSLSPTSRLYGKETLTLAPQGP